MHFERTNPLAATVPMAPSHSNQAQPASQAELQRLEVHLASLQALQQLHQQAGNRSLQLSRQSGVFDANMQLFKFNQGRSNRLNQRMAIGTKTGLYGGKKATNAGNRPLPRMLYHQFSDFSSTQITPSTVHRFPNPAANMTALEPANLSVRPTERESLLTESNPEKEDGPKGPNFNASSKELSLNKPLARKPPTRPMSSAAPDRAAPHRTQSVQAQQQPPTRIVQGRPMTA